MKDFKQMLKDKRVVGGGIAFVVIFVVLVGLVIWRINSPATGGPTLSQDETTPVVKMNPEEIGLTLDAPQGKYFQLTVSKLEGIEKLDWEFSYDADVAKDPDFPAADTEGQKIGQSFEGHATKADFTGDTYTSLKRELGSCSKNICRFDTGIEKIDLVMKVTKSDGKVYQINDSISL
jgi:hypothetical protein